MTTYEHPNPAIAGFEPGIVAGISALLIIVVMAVAVATRNTSGISTSSSGATSHVGAKAHTTSHLGGRLAVQRSRSGQ